MTKLDIDKIIGLMAKIEYGWVDKNGQKHYDFANFSTDYILQTPKDVIKSRVGVCWDQVELERYYFKDYEMVKTYFIVYYKGECPTHTFLTYKLNNKYYWFEHAWEIFKGVHEYNTIEELLENVKNNFIKYELNGSCDKDYLRMYEYTCSKAHLNVQEFFQEAESGIKIL